MKVGIIGSRKLSVDVQEMYFLLKDFPMDLIISGGAIGIDSIARSLAEDYMIEYREYLPNYSLYGKRATFIRNRAIVENSDLLIAFWDGESKGTKYTLNYAKKLGKETKVFMYTKQLSLF